MYFELLLYNVKTPANVGSIYRLAHQFDCKKIYTYRSSLPSKTNTYRIERRVDVVALDSMDFLKDFGTIKIAVETGGTHVNPLAMLPKILVDSGMLIAVGNESLGISEEHLKLFDYIYTLRAVKQESYNVSHALAIALYSMFNDYGWR